MSSKKECQHRVFRETRSGSDQFRCKNPRCRLVIDLDDTVDLQNGEHATISGSYNALVIYVKSHEYR